MDKSCKVGDKKGMQPAEFLLVMLVLAMLLLTV